MKIRKSELGELPVLMEIYATARRFMAEHGNPNQWGPTNWPPEGLIRDDIEKGKSYVCEHNGKIVGCFFYDYGDDIEPTYREITDGEWLDDSSYGVVHRVASSGECRGVGSAAIGWAIEKSRHLRMDTHGDNTVMQNLLAKIGMTKCGIIHVEEDDYPRLAYEITVPERSFDITDKVSAEDKAAVYAGLLEYNLSKLEDKRISDIGVYHRENGVIKAGLTGRTIGKWLTVDYLWVDEALRGRGIGAAILKAAEDEAIRRGCEYCFLDTFDFQAPKFYEKYGYREVLTLEHYPQTGKRHYYTKELKK